MAKVQEAKEIPTVKVLDPPQIPDKKSFPPRLLIIFAGTVFAVATAIIWLFAKTAWQQTDVQDTRKIFAQELATDLRTQLPGFLRARTGDRNGGRATPSETGRRVLNKDESQE
jgi:membrane-associated protease RseP (regulator of RpoE activity)